MSEYSKYMTVAKVNFKHTTWISYMIASICAVAMIVDAIIDRMLSTVGDTSVSVYSMLYIICILAPILIASVNYSKFMNIGVKKKTYLYGSFINYAVFAAAVSVIGVIEMYVYDKPMNVGITKVYGLIEVFGWDTNFLTAFLSQFSFLLLAETIIHTLTFIQTKLYGWIADVIIIVVISVFTPIKPLRAVEEFVFNIVIFSKPIIQISSCLVLSIIIYLTNLFYLKKRV